MNIKNLIIASAALTAGSAALTFAATEHFANREVRRSEAALKIVLQNEEARRIAKREAEPLTIVYQIYITD